METEEAEREKRRAALGARLAGMQAERLAEREKKRAVIAAERSPAESVAAFWVDFRATLKKLDEAMEAAEAAKEAGEERSKLSDRWSALNALCTELAERTAAANYFLAPYDRRQAQRNIASAKARVEEARGVLLPRKKFSFRSRRKKKKEETAADGAGGDGEALSGSKEEEAAGGGGGSGSAASRFAAAVEEYKVVDRDGERVSLVASDLPAERTDVRLSSLNDCSVTLYAVLGALRLDRLRNCRIYATAVAGSAYFDDCVNCTFFVASRQIRIHSSVDCAFYLHVMSHPIIEHCSRLQFASCAALRADALDEQRAAAGLSAASEEWKNVDDFNWHRTQHSPNWALLNEADYVTHADSHLVWIGDKKEDGKEEGKEEGKEGKEEEEEEEEEEDGESSDDDDEL